MALNEMFRTNWGFPCWFAILTALNIYFGLNGDKNGVISSSISMALIYFGHFVVSSTEKKPINDLIPLVESFLPIITKFVSSKYPVCQVPNRQIETTSQPIKYLILPESSGTDPTNTGDIIQIYPTDNFVIPARGSTIVRTGVLLMIPSGIRILLTQGVSAQNISVRVEILTSIDRNEIRVSVENKSNEAVELNKNSPLAKLLIFGPWNGELINHLE